MEVRSWIRRGRRRTPCGRAVVPRRSSWLELNERASKIKPFHAETQGGDPGSKGTCQGILLETISARGLSIENNRIDSP